MLHNVLASCVFAGYMLSHKLAFPRLPRWLEFCKRYLVILCDSSGTWGFEFQKTEEESGTRWRDQEDGESGVPV